MKRSKSGHTPKQYAYATRMLNGSAKTKKEAALLSGFSPTVAANAHNKIEKTEGYHNAIIGLASESNNLVLAILHEYKARGFTKFSNKDLNSALNAIASAWDRIEKKREPNKLSTPEGNRLHAVFRRKTETVTISSPAAAEGPIHVDAVDVTPPEDDPNDF